ncbi:MAG: hypothetical protein ABFS56_19190 [Pseudomonadota bacterium]
MTNLEKIKEYSVSILGLKVEGISSENTNNVRQALVILLKNNPQVFEANKSPQEILQALGFDIQETQKGKNYEESAKRLESVMTPEVSAIFEEGEKEFRDAMDESFGDRNKKYLQEK